MHETKPFRVLIAVDGSRPGRAALRWAYSFLAGIDGPSTAEVFTVWVPTERMGLDGFGLIDDSGYPQEAEALLQELLRDEGSPSNVTPSVGSGRPVESVVLAAFGQDLLVMGTRADGPVRQALVGSMSQAVVGRVACPVAVVPQQFPDPGGLTVVGWDGTRGAIAALRWALTHRAIDKVRVVFVAEPLAPAPDRTTIREDIADVFDDATASCLDLELRYGDPKTELASNGSDVAEIVVGDRAHVDADGSIWGSVTSHVLSTTTLPVIVVPAENAAIPGSVR